MDLKQNPEKSAISVDDSPSSDCGPSGTCPQDLEKLESDVNQMAHKVLELRSSLPDQLKSTLASVSVAERPLVSEVSDITGHSESEAPNSGASEPDDLIGEKGAKFKDPENAEKVHLLKQKISSNASALPIVLKRMKDCIARIDMLESSNVIIHPAFKRRKTK